MDEPMPNPQRYEADNGPAASFGEDEWSTELERLASKLDTELKDVTESAVREVSTTIRAFERRGLRLYQQIEDRRREAEEEQHTMLARVAETQANIAAIEKEILEERRKADTESAATINQANRRADAILTQAEARAAEIVDEAEERRRTMEAQEEEVLARIEELQSSIAAVEQEVEEERARAESEADSIVDGARHRAEAIVAEAEARAAETLAAAHTEAASRRAQRSSRGAAGSDAEVEDRLRGLSARVGQLLETRSPRPISVPTTPAEAETPVDRHAEDRAEDEDETPTQVMEIESRPTQPTGPRPISITRDDEDEEEEERHEAPTMPMTPPVAATQAASPTAEDEEDDEPEAPAASPAASEPAAIRQPDPPSRPSATPVAGGPVSQTVIFQSVPNFQAALALERSLKGMPDVREVRVADFDERQLTFQVTHELGDGLARVLLAQRGSELQLVEARADRIELSFRS